MEWDTQPRAGQGPRKAQAPLGSTSSAPCLFFSHRRHFVISRALLGGIATAILGSTLSAPFDSTRLHWKHHECSLGSTSSPLVLIPPEQFPILQEASARCIAPRPHALRLVFKRQWSGTHNHTPAKVIYTDASFSEHRNGMFLLFDQETKSQFVCDAACPDWLMLVWNDATSHP